MEGKLYKVVVGKKMINDFDYIVNVFSPINNQIIGSIPKIYSKKQVHTIFHSAKQSFYEYQNTTFIQRKEYLLTFCDLIKNNWDEISNIITWETGKTKHESIKEIDFSIDYIKAIIETYEKSVRFQQVNEIDSNTNKKIETLVYEPVGVVLALNSFNYPIASLINKITSALISGNVVAFLPDKQSQCVATLISKLLYEAGFKNGEISCLICDDESIKNEILNNFNIDKIVASSYLDSLEYNHYAPIYVNKYGQNTAILLKDANLEKATKEIVESAFEFNGQNFLGVKKVLVDEEIKNEVINLIDIEIEKLSIGSAAKGNFNITEMINISKLKDSLYLLLDAYRNNARTNQKIKRKANILYPIALHNLSYNKAKISKVNQMCPILPIISFSEIEEAIDLCNQTKNINQVSIYGQDKKYIKKIAQTLNAETVNINNTFTWKNEIAIFNDIDKKSSNNLKTQDLVLSVNKIKSIVETE